MDWSGIELKTLDRPFDVSGVAPLTVSKCASSHLLDLIFVKAEPFTRPIQSNLCIWADETVCFECC